MFDRIITPVVTCHAVIFTAKHPDLTWLWSVGHCQLSLQVFAILYCSIYPAPHRASAQLAPSTGWPSRTGPNNPTWWTANHGRAGSEESNLAKTDPATSSAYFLEDRQRWRRHTSDRFPPHKDRLGDKWLFDETKLNLFDSQRLADNVWDSQAQKNAGDLKKYVSKISITSLKEKVYTLSHLLKIAGLS